MAGRSGTLQIVFVMSIKIVHFLYFLSYGPLILSILKEPLTQDFSVVMSTVELYSRVPKLNNMHSLNVHLELMPTIDVRQLGLLHRWLGLWSTFLICAVVRRPRCSGPLTINGICADLESYYEAMLTTLAVLPIYKRFSSRAHSLKLLIYSSSLRTARMKELLGVCSDLI